MFTKSLFFFILVTTSVNARSTKSTNTNKIVRFPQGLTWTNNAWGQKNSNDEVEGMKVIDVDLFDEDESRIQKLKQDGHIVVCYISAGTIEDWRQDVKENKSAWKEVAGKKMGDWERETWIDITKLDKIKPLMSNRWVIAKEKGCDAIEADNVDCYQNNCISGKKEKELRSYQIQYNKWQAEEAHRLGLAIGLKNSLGLIRELVDDYDFAMNEECVRYGECDMLKPFKDQNKAIFGSEYKISSQNCKIGQEHHMMMKQNKGKGWENCFEGVNKLPETEYTDGAVIIDDDDDDDELPIIPPTTTSTSVTTNTEEVVDNSNSATERCMSDSNAVVLSTNCNSQNDNEQIHLVVGDYKRNELETLIRNIGISEVRVKKGYSVLLFSEDNFKGQYRFVNVDSQDFCFKEMFQSGQINSIQVSMVSCEN
eukprot:Pgem_evm1s825